MTCPELGEIVGRHLEKSEDSSRAMDPSTCAECRHPVVAGCVNQRICIVPDERFGALFGVNLVPGLAIKVTKRAPGYLLVLTTYFKVLPVLPSTPG